MKKQDLINEYVKNIYKVLDNYPFEKRKTDVDLENTILYLVDKKAIDELLYLEISFNEKILDFKRAGADEERYFKNNNFRKHCKLLNTAYCAYRYTIHIYNKFKDVRDRDKVYNYLDGEFSVWRNSFLKHSKIALSQNKNIDVDFVQEQEKLITDKIKKAEKEFHWIKNNYEDLEVRINSKKRSKKYGTIYLYYNIREDVVQKMHRDRFHLDINRPNILWYTPKEDTSSDTFIKSSKNPFGDVYYRKKLN